MIIAGIQKNTRFCVCPQSHLGWKTAETDDLDFTKFDFTLFYY